MHRNDPPRCTRFGTPGSRVVAVDGALRIMDRAIRGRDDRGIIVRPVPIAAPFPDVARHIDQAKAVAANEPAGAARMKPSSATILVGEMPFPDVRHVMAVGLELVTPHVRLAIQAATGRKLPFGLGRQALTGPLGVSLR